MKTKDLVIKAIEEEPLFPGPIPEDIFKTFKNAEMDQMTELLRSVVRVTKNSILDRIKKLEF